jgi:nucleotide-binding universal stress UspA family protein
MSVQHSSTHRVVVGVDGSDESKLALRWATVIAASYGADIDAVAVWEFPNVYGAAPMPGGFDPKHDMEKCLTQTVDDVFGAHRPQQLHLMVQEGHAGQVLIEQSESASMLVVGSRGHGGFAGLLLGSVSAKVAEHAYCPVLVIHGDQDPLVVPV